MLDIGKIFLFLFWLFSFIAFAVSIIWAVFFR